MKAGRGSLWRPSARRASAFAVAVVALLLLGVVSAHCGLPRFALHAFDEPAIAAHQPVKSPSTGSAHLPDHDGATSACPAKPPAAAVDGSAGPALAGTTIATPAAGVAALIGPVAGAVRGPPARFSTPLTGQARLARFCVSRR